MLCSSIDAILLSLNRCDFHYKIHSSFCSEVCIFQETTFCWAPSPPSAPVLQANHVRRQGENVEPRQGLRVRPSDRCCLLSFFFLIVTTMAVLNPKTSANSWGPGWTLGRRRLKIWRWLRFFWTQETQWKWRAKYTHYGCLWKIWRKKYQPFTHVLTTEGNKENIKEDNDTFFHCCCPTWKRIRPESIFEWKCHSVGFRW